MLIGTALVALGSSYYHLHPDNARLFWDRLPMTVAFMSLLALTSGRGRMLPPLLILGAASVMYWRYTEDLRPYVLIQFGTMLVIPLLLLRRSGDRLLWGMVVLYALAKLLELFDHQIAAVIPTGGHPWKHLTAALAILCCIQHYARRRGSLLPEGSNGVDLNRAPGRKPACQERDRDHREEDNPKTQGIGGLNPVEDLPK